jgi:DNA mismatch repair protein MutH
MSRYHSIDDVLRQATRLKGKTLREIVGGEVPVSSGNKGAFGQLLESHGFGIPNNSAQEPDFQPIGVELKVVPLKKKGRSWDVKERTKVCMIQYHELVRESWETSHCKAKLNHILFVFYRHEKNLWDRIVEGHLLYVMEDRDEAVAIRRDWIAIRGRVEEGKAETLSESLTTRLAASTAGSRAEDVSQPYSSVGARKRAFSLKPAYTRTLRAELIQKKKFDSVLDLEAFEPGMDIGQFLLSRLHRFEGRLLTDIAGELGVPIKGGKASNAGFIRKMLGFTSGKGHIKEIAECGITLRVVPVNPANGTLWEAVSFPHQTLADILEEEDFESSALCAATQSMLVVPVYRGRSAQDKGARLGRAHFWEPDGEHLMALMEEWALCRSRIQQALDAGRRRIMLPSELLPSTETTVAHFRPHARNAADTESSLGFPIVKSSFWLNRDALQIDQ